MEGLHYYAKDRVRETHVTNPFFTERNVGYDVLEWEKLINICFLQKRKPQSGELEGSHHYAKDRVWETHATNPYLTKRNVGYDVLEWEEHINNCFRQKRKPKTGDLGRLILLC